MLSQLNNSDSVVSLNNFSKFNPKVDFSSNKSYLTNAYGHNFEYYNDPKTEKNKKLRYILVTASTAIVVIDAFIGAMRSGKISLDKLRKAEEAVQKSTVTESIQNIAMNFTNVKDDLWDRFACFLSDKFNVGIIPLDSIKGNYLFIGGESCKKGECNDVYNVSIVKNDKNEFVQIDFVDNCFLPIPASFIDKEFVKIKEGKYTQFEMKKNNLIFYNFKKNKFKSKQF